MWFAWFVIDLLLATYTCSFKNDFSCSVCGSKFLFSEFFFNLWCRILCSKRDFCQYLCYLQWCITKASWIFLNQEQFINVSKAETILLLRPQFPVKLKRKCWGCWAKMRRNEKNQKFKPSLPLIMGNLSSLGTELKEV